MKSILHYYQHHHNYDDDDDDDDDYATDWQMAVRRDNVISITLRQV